MDDLAPPYLRAAESLRENPEQWEIYNSTGNCIALAGPGSGKTKTLTITTARLLSEEVLAPRGIACITYNSECARELRRRFDDLGLDSASNLFIGTLHSFCLSNLVAPFGALAGLEIPEPLSVAPPSTQDAEFAAALARVVSAEERPANWRTRFDRYRRTHPDREAPDWREDEQLADLIEEYESALRARGQVDFDDLVLLGLKLSAIEWVQKCLLAKYPILVIDEYQDLGQALHLMVENLCLRGGIRLLAFGDPDQSIYGFAGARPELLRELSGANGVETVRLKFNYRSGQNIIAASEAALGEKRNYKSTREEPGTISFHERPDGLRDQAEFISRELIPDILSRDPDRTLGGIAVLYPSRTDGTIIAESVNAAGLKYIRIDGGAPYAKTPLMRWLEDCAKWCSGGWRMGSPRLSRILNGLHGFNGSRNGESAAGDLELALVEFLFANRNPDGELGAWLAAMHDSCLERLIDDQPTLLDEKETFVKLQASCAPTNVLSDWTVATFGGQGGAPDHLNLITLHSAKGLEFDAVIMMGMDQGKIPSWYAQQSADEKRESRRVFYVGLTRARYEVHMTYSGWNENQYGRRFNNGPSEFLLEVKRLIRS